MFVNRALETLILLIALQPKKWNVQHAILNMPVSQVRRLLEPLRWEINSPSKVGTDVTFSLNLPPTSASPALEEQHQALTALRTAGLAEP